MTKPVFTAKDMAEVLADFDAAPGKDLPMAPKNPNEIGRGRYIALYAAQNDHVATLRYLEMLGVDLHSGYSTNAYVPGRNPLELAESSDSKNAVAFLNGKPTRSPRKTRELAPEGCFIG